MVFAIRNTDFKENNTQIELMTEKFDKDEKNPKIKESTYFSVLKAFEQYTLNKNNLWKFEFVKKSNIAFLIGSSSL